MQFNNMAGIAVGFFMAAGAAPMAMGQELPETTLRVLGNFSSGVQVRIPRHPTAYSSNIRPAVP